MRTQSRNSSFHISFYKLLNTNQILYLHFLYKLCPTRSGKESQPTEDPQVEQAATNDPDDVLIISYRKTTPSASDQSDQPKAKTLYVHHYLLIFMIPHFILYIYPIII